MSQLNPDFYEALQLVFQSMGSARVISKFESFWADNVSIMSLLCKV